MHVIAKTKSAKTLAKTIIGALFYDNKVKRVYNLISPDGGFTCAYNGSFWTARKAFNAGI